MRGSQHSWMTRLFLIFRWALNRRNTNQYFEDLRPTTKLRFDGSSRSAGNRAPNTGIGPKDFLELASTSMWQAILGWNAFVTVSANAAKEFRNAGIFLPQLILPCPIADLIGENW